jgi:hypothetical protein
MVSLDRYQLLRSLVGQGYSQVILDERNERVLASLPSGQDCVLIWGIGHVPGVAAGLRRAGYQRQASAWLNAGELPPLRTGAKVIWAACRAA